MKNFLNMANGEMKYSFALDASGDVRKAKTVMDANIRAKNPFQFNVDDVPAEAKEAQKKAESESFIKKAGSKIGNAFQTIFSPKSKYSDLRTDTQKRADMLGGIWTDTRPIYNGVSPYNVLMASGSPGGEIWTYLKRNGRSTYVVPLLNVIAAYRLGTGKEGYGLISQPVLIVANAFIEWCRIIYGDDMVIKQSLGEVDQKIINAFKAQNPELAKEAEKFEENNTGGTGGVMNEAIMYVVIAAVVILLITKFF